MFMLIEDQLMKIAIKLPIINQQRNIEYYGGQPLQRVISEWSNDLIFEQFPKMANVTISSGSSKKKILEIIVDKPCVMLYLAATYAV
jgi:hypothetical protein